MAKRTHFPKEILIWLAIHGGDPNPEAMSEADQLLLFQALKGMAASLPNAGLRTQIQALTTKAMADIAQQMARG